MTGKAEQKKRIKYYIIFLLLSVLILLVYTVMKEYENQKRADRLRTGNPLEQILNRDFKYTFDFNRLGNADQKKIIDELLAVQNKSVYRLKEVHPKNSNTFFEPQLLIYMKGRIHFIAFMKSNWTSPEIDWDVGKINTSVFITAKENLPAENPWTLAGFPGMLSISDFEWNDRYKMYTVNMNREITDTGLNLFLLQPKIDNAYIKQNKYDPSNWRINFLQRFEFSNQY